MPIITGGVIEKDGKFLLVQEAQERCRGKWNIPAGHLDPGETIFDAAKREVREETGCEVELANIAQIVNRVAEDEVWMYVIFSTTLLTEDIQFDTAEILDVKWFSYDEILAMHDQLRRPDLILAVIDNVREHKTHPLDLITILV